MLEESVIEAMVGDTFARLLEYRQRWDIYRGDLAKPLQVDPETGTDDNVLLPVLRTFVKKSRSFLFGKGFTYELGDLTGSKGDEWLAANLRNMKYPSLTLKQATNGGVTGHNFVKFVPDPTNAQSTRHRVVVLDPSNVTPVWSEDDHEDVWAWIITTNTVRRDGKPVIRKDEWVRADSGESWTWSRYEAELSSADLDKDGAYVPQKGKRFRWSQIVRDTVWPYAWAPFFHCQNQPVPNEFFGESDIDTAVQNLGDALVRMVSNGNKTLRHFAHPKTVALGVDVEEWDNAIGKPLVLGNEDAKVFNLEMQSDLNASLAFIQLLLEQLHAAARVPRIATDSVENVGQLSSLALKILYGPLLELTADKQLTYGDMQVDLFTRMLEFSKVEMGTSFVVVKYPDPLPQDAKTMAETAKAQQEAGASERTTLEEMGFDPDTEFENRQEERVAQPDTFGLMQRITEQQPPSSDAQAAPTSGAVPATTPDTTA